MHVLYSEIQYRGVCSNWNCRCASLGKRKYCEIFVFLV